MDAEAAPQASSSLVLDSSTTLRRLLDETADLIDSPTFTHVLTLLLDSGFSNLVDQKLSTQAFKLPGPSASGTGIEEIIPEDVKAKLPTILACFSRQAHSIGNGVPNEYLQSMESVRELEAFAAVIYSSHFEFEAHGDDAGGSSKEKNAEGSTVNGKSMETNPTVEEDTVTSNQEKSFESAWDRAVEKADVEKP
jgi:peroxin-3